MMVFRNGSAALVAAVFISFVSVRAESDAEDWTRIYAVESPALSIDGSQLCFSWCNTNWTASVTGGIAHVTAKPPCPFDAGPFTNEMYKAMASECTLSPDSTRVAFRFRGDNPFRRRRNTFSSRAGEIWLYDSASKTFTNLVKRASNCYMPVWLGKDSIAYLAQDGRGGCEVRRLNLVTGSDTTLIPTGTHDMANFLTVGTSSNEYVLVVRHGWDLWRYALDANGNIVDSEKLLFHPESAWKGRNPVRKRRYGKSWNNDAAGSVAMPPDKCDVIFTAGGDLWAVKPGKGTNAVLRLRGETRSHERGCVLTPDGSTLYYLRDWGDHAEVWGMRRNEPEKPWHNQKSIHNWPVARGDGLRTRLAISPAGDRLSWVDWAGGFYVVSTNVGAKVKDYTPPGTRKQWEYAWSPNGHHVAMAASDDTGNVDVWVIPMTGTNVPVNVSDQLMWDGSPQWTTNSAKLVFKGRFRSGGATRMFAVDMKKPLRRGACQVVPKKDEKALVSQLVKSMRPALPHFRVTQNTVLADYQELAFLTMWGRMRARLCWPKGISFDWSAIREKYLPAARNAPSWSQFQQVVLMMFGELDASHLGFSAKDHARKEWSLPKKSTGRFRKKIGNVDANRRWVKKATDGRWSYVHMAAMGADDYDKFLVDLYREGTGRDGIILDLRGNHGGFCADHVLDCLMTNPHGWSEWQGGGRGYLPNHLGTPHFSGKIIALIDERTFSNGEMIAHFLKALGRATLVGRPTAGGVLSTTNMKVLDWGEFRVPHGRWFAADGVEMENHGAEPDVRVDDTPAEWARNFDSQLEKAIELIKN